MRNPFSKASRDARMAKMQERADRIIAEQNAKGVAAQEEYARWQASQGGGGASVGGQQATAPPSFDPNQPLPPIRDLLKQSLEYAKDSVGELFDDRRDVLDPGDANLNKPPPELEDPAQREQWAADERAAREEARAPYLAATKPAVERTRFATIGRTQLEEVTERLKGFDPARVYGVYRVPDRYDLKRNNENKARVKWEIAHAPEAAGSSEVHLAAFNRADHWAVRRLGEPSVLDEDVAGALVARARLEPEDCFGLPRLLQVRATETEDSKFWDAHVEGILAFARKPLAAAQEQLLTEAPLALATAPPFHVEILDWESVAAWVAPSRYTPPRTPSPLPHLPSSWEELTDAYLEVVGVRSEDCYGVQATRAGTKSGLPDLSLASVRSNARGGHELIHAAELVVIAYRDREEYEAGRSRWRAYQDEVLRARLDRLSGQRPPLDTEYRPPPSFLSEVFDMFNPLDPMHAFPQVFGRRDRPQLGPYCGEA